MDLTVNIINNDLSFKAKDIKLWCEKLMSNEENEFSYDAQELYFEYWNDLNTNNYPPNPNVYYYAEKYRDYKGFTIWRLTRDVEKSPKKNTN